MNEKQGGAMREKYASHSLDWRVKQFFSERYSINGARITEESG